MHELAICKNVLELVDAEARSRGFTRVLAIKLRVGEYSGLIPDCIREFFPIAARDSIAENARLDIESIAARFSCLDCGYEGVIDRKSACCPSCHGTAIRMTAGREFFVENLTVE